MKKQFITLGILLAILTAVSVYASNVNILNGDLVKAAGSSAVYYIQGATKRVFPHFNVYHSWGYPTDYSTVKTVTASELAAYTDGNPMPFRDGSLFRGYSNGLSGYAANAVYYVQGGKIYPIQSSAIYQALFKDPTWLKVIWIPNDLLNKFTYPLGTMITTSSTHPDGSLIQYAGSTQKYLIVDGAKRAISDAAFVANRYLAANVLIVSSNETYLDGPVITGTENGLLTPGWTGVNATTSTLLVSLVNNNLPTAFLQTGTGNIFLFKTQLTAGTNDATITGLTFTRTVGIPGDWSKLYLYEGNTLITPNGRTISTNTNTVEFALGPALEHIMPEGRITLTLDKVCFFPEHQGLLIWNTVRFQVCIEREQHDTNLDRWAPIEFNDCYVTAFERTGPENPQDPNAYYDRMDLAVAYTVSVDGAQKKPMETDEVKAWLARWTRR